MVTVNGLNISLIPMGTPAQDWARIMNDNFAVIDYHNHTWNYGIQIDSTALTFGDLFMNHYSIRHASSLTFSPNATIPINLYTLFVNPNGDLTYQTPTYTLPLTSGGNLNVVNPPEGFTVPNAPPNAFFVGADLGIYFLSSARANTSTMIASVMNCTGIVTQSSFTVTNLAHNPVLIDNNKNSYYAGVVFPGAVNTDFTATYFASRTAQLYKLSESGNFYYDDAPYVVGTTYDLSYFPTSKNWVSSPNTNKQNKTGVQYTMQDYIFNIPSNLIMNETIVIDPAINPNGLVSCCPKIKTFSGENPIATDNNSTIYRTMKIPKFNFHLGNNALSCTVSIDLSDFKGSFPGGAQVIFNVIYANTNYPIESF